jgi:hypothetical protein
MNKLNKFINKLPWQTVIILCLTLGLAPFAPPHLYEKLGMLVSGNLIKLIDWFDLLFHGFPWLVLFLKLYYSRSDLKIGGIAE